MGKLISEWTEKMKIAGVDPGHIESMKFKYLDDEHELKCYYDYVETDEHHTLVDIEDIKGIDTGWDTAGRSVYNLFFSVTSELDDTNKNELKYKRIKENLDSLIENGLEYQYNFYVDYEKDDQLRDGLPSFSYFEEDGIYFSGATHRTVSALMFGAPKMVGYLDRFVKNPVKYNNYKTYLSVNEKWTEFLACDLKSFIIQDDVIGRRKEKCYSLSLNENPNSVLIKFEDPIKNSKKINFKNSDFIVEYSRNIESIIDRIVKLDDRFSEQIKKKSIVVSLARFFESKGNSLLYDFLCDYYDSKDRFINLNYPIEQIIEALNIKIRLNELEER